MMGRKVLSLFALSLSVLLPGRMLGARCDLDIESLRDSPSFTTLARHDQQLILKELHDDIAEMAEVDVAGSSKNYLGYFATHLEYKEITGGAPDGRLLLLRYSSNTLCGSSDNCPVWVVELMQGKKGASRAVSLIHWRPGFGTSAEGSWAVATPIGAKPEFPELMFLTHLSRYQTGVHCYRKIGKLYMKVACSPDCAEVIRNLRRPPGASKQNAH
ncbi:hypothetical protein [Acidipila rosea]|uniref:Uncharacterized protein n=1 Tax=Acidipila rosea TaxID=768535 RepID=A0A4R1LCI4_9BACT|nr:hypothetical protein [Acidipila rosea]TCK74249.1 hypothetical protein C7378_1871 [Acidipila rosea]